jgi:DNA-binding CsgD family transcriptional regulator
MRNLVLGALESEMGRAEDAVRILEEGLDAQPAPDDALVADLTTELAWATGYSGRPASDMLRVLRRLENLHISDPVTDTRAAVIRVFGHAASFGCRSALGDPLIAALPTEAKRAPVAMTDVLVLRGTMRILSGDLAAAVDDLKVAVERYRGGLRTKMLGVAHINLALSKWWAGQWDEADGIAGLAIDLCQESDLAAAYALASYTPAVRGEWVQARKYLDEGMRRAQDIPKLEWVAHLMTGQVLLAHASQNNEMLLDFLRNMDAGVLGRMQERMLGWGAYHISAIHAYGLLLAGRHEDALILSQKVPMVSSQPTWMRQLVHWVAGGIQAANGNQEDAADQYELALESFPAGSKFFEANALHDLSKLVARAGRHRQSGKLSREAYEHYQALRADPFMRMASENLSRLGLPSGDAASNGHLALTSREQQIAQLVRRGLTNKEIATELYVSTKTVEYHLGHTFMKLGVSKRQELRYHPALTQP